MPHKKPFYCDDFACENLNLFIYVVIIMLYPIIFHKSKYKKIKGLSVLFIMS